MQVTEHIHALKIPFRLRAPSGQTIDRFAYAFLIYGQRLCLIDTGVASARAEIFEYIRKTGRGPDEISLIMQTHTHPDHIGATRSIKEATGAAVMVHPAERAWLEDVDLQFRERPVPGFYDLVDGSVEVDRLLEDGDVVDLGNGLKLEVFHTPGHSGGSLSLLLPEDGVLFCGDAVPLPGDIPIYEDVTAAVRSIKRLKKLTGIRCLLASWDDPREGDRACQAMDEGLEYLQRVHEAVIEAAGDCPPLTQELIRPVLAALGLPARAANPLVSRSLEAHLRVLDRRDLLAE
ncbi:MAG TPA: MBL fold metallo-hydrolase [Spirochaetia bacterium]|nr:MBL fold metallo-hydrolase [Spirochaetia bacterium]